MTKSGLPNSIRKHMRSEKARLRRENLRPEITEQKIRAMTERIFMQYGKKLNSGKKNAVTPEII